MHAMRCAVQSLGTATPLPKMWSVDLFELQPVSASVFSPELKNHVSCAPCGSERRPCRGITRQRFFIQLTSSCETQWDVSVSCEKHNPGPGANACPPSPPPLLSRYSFESMVSPSSIPRLRAPSCTSWLLSGGWMSPAVGEGGMGHNFPSGLMMAVRSHVH